MGVSVFNNEFRKTASVLSKLMCWVACFRLPGVSMLTRYRVKACHPSN